MILHANSLVCIPFVIEKLVLVCVGFASYFLPSHRALEHYCSLQSKNLRSLLVQLTDFSITKCANIVTVIPVFF